MRIKEEKTLIINFSELPYLKQGIYKYILKNGKYSGASYSDTYLKEMIDKRIYINDEVVNIYRFLLNYFNNRSIDFIEIVNDYKRGVKWVIQKSKDM